MAILRIIGVMAILVPTLLCGCTAGASEGGQAPSATSASPFTDIKARGSINVGVVPDMPGWSLLDQSRATWGGFDIALVEWISNRLDLKPNYIPITVGQREMMLGGAGTSPRVDLVVAAYSITDARRQNVAFAGPYIRTRQGVMIRKGDKISSLDDLKDKDVCTVRGSTSAKQLKEYGIPYSEEEGFGVCISRLLQGQAVDAVSTDQLILAGFAREHADDLYVVPDLTFGSLEFYGIGIPRGDIESCRTLTKELSAFMTSGDWAEAFNQRFPGLKFDNYRPDPYNLDSCV